MPIATNSKCFNHIHNVHESEFRIIHYIAPILLLSLTSRCTCAFVRLEYYIFFENILFIFFYLIHDFPFGLIAITFLLSFSNLKIDRISKIGILKLFKFGFFQILKLFRFKKVQI
jgi:hypothetical protein